MAKDKKQLGDAATLKLGVGERIEFSDIASYYVDTRFGMTQIVNFANAEGKITRKCFAQGGMLQFIKDNPEARSICLKKKLVDGDLTFNIWST